ncbi:sarcosine oxidase subunit alpha family protein [Rhodobacteraceae bacterium F11138]|nr:sarcosine oxidase subunit alpha family protein [Rhodobacteraceae bacterium F11138]
MARKADLSDAAMLAEATVTFTFDGKTFTGRAGDTVASALLANDVHMVARSFKYHRPRGIISIGSEEPCALLTVTENGTTEPNTRATQIPLQDGLQLRSQNRWPSLGTDVFGVLNRFSAFFPAGFYYKTFMGPKGAWPFYERIIRRMAGLGQAPEMPDPARYESNFAHCDVLVAGGGAAGLSAALAAGRSGARVMLAEEQDHTGLGLLPESATIDGCAPRDWAAAMLRALQDLPNVRILQATTVAGVYDHNFVTLTERRPLLNGDAPQPRQRLWKLRAREIVMATGAAERPVLFANNDLPGVMLSSAVRAYADRYGVLAGKQAVVATSHDGGCLTACALADHGISIGAVVDSRATCAPDVAAALAKRGIGYIASSDVVAATGRKHVTGAEIRDRATGQTHRVDCDLVAMAGGWSPNAHLYAHTRRPLEYDRTLGAFVPGNEAPNFHSAGACAGKFGLAAAIAGGTEAGQAAAASCGLAVDQTERPRVIGQDYPVAPPDGIPAGLREKSTFVDLQNDVTMADIRLATRENYAAVEHLKRYTTLGMGTDQGKLGNLNGLAVLADLRGVDVAQLGTTTFRPPYTPITFAAVQGQDHGEAHHPVRRGPAHDAHERLGAVWTNAGLWKRPQFYPRPGETDLEAVNREVLAVRSGAGIVDVSTLGKIDIQGPGAIELLERVYMNGFRSLPVGKGRYGVMLREDGMVFDDGVTMRLSETHFLMSTTTGQVQQVHEHLTRQLADRWPGPDVFVTDVTENWFSCALAGPKAREVLAGLTDIDLSPDALPFMGCAQGKVAGLDARLFRISFSGELSYEINVSSDCGAALWNRLLDHGAPMGLIHYGVESMGVMRVEKGLFVVGREADGRMTADDLGLGRMASRKKDYIGAQAQRLPGVTGAGRRQLVGLRPVDAAQTIPRGASIIAADAPDGPAPPIGHVTSQVFSPHLKSSIALAAIEDGRARMDTQVLAAGPLEGRRVAATIVDPVFIDPQGERLHA